MATILRQPLYSPNRALALKHDDPVQNLQQTTLKVVVALLPFFTADHGRPHALAQNRYDPIGTSYQQFLVPPATDPAINVWFSRPGRLEPRRDESAEKNYQLFPAVVATTPVINADFSRPLGLSSRKDDSAQLFFRATIPGSNAEFGRPGILRSAKDTTSGLNVPLVFPPPATKPFTFPDLSARAQSPYSRVDGPLGSPLLLVFPLPPSVLPFNTYDVSARPVNPLIAGQDAPGINLQLFPPTVIDTGPQLGPIGPMANSIGFYDHGKKKKKRQESPELPPQTDEPIPEAPIFKVPLAQFMDLSREVAVAKKALQILDDVESEEELQMVVQALWEFMNADD